MHAEYKPAEHKAAEGGIGGIFALKEKIEKKKKDSVQLTSNKSMKEATRFSGRNAPKGKKKQKLKPDDDQP